MQIKYYTTRPDFEPKKATVGSAGYDLQADLRGSILAYDQYNLIHRLFPQENAIRIPALWRVLIPTGLHAETPYGHFWDLCSRSSIPLKKGLLVANGKGTIDQDYTGEMLICFINATSVPVTITDGERVGQVILRKMEFFDWLRSEQPIKPTVRGSGGFGSTGV